MSRHHYNDIRRDGFFSRAGRFMTEPDAQDRVEGSQLRSMFLPKLSRDGQKALRDNRNFVRSQLKRGIRQTSIIWRWNSIDEGSPPSWEVRQGS